MRFISNALVSACAGFAGAVLAIHFMVPSIVSAAAPKNGGYDTLTVSHLVVTSDIAVNSDVLHPMSFSNSKGVFLDVINNVRPDPFGNYGIVVGGGTNSPEADYMGSGVKMLSYSPGTPPNMVWSSQMSPETGFSISQTSKDGAVQNASLAAFMLSYTFKGSKPADARNCIFSTSGVSGAPMMTPAGTAIPGTACGH